uniref:Translation elongation factor EF1B beta/delta subunit guanine nucleotide exchange domain-containing protein n=1 Tax=Ciona savignyi TaxID=51511 RepID=H2YHW6_CIOSA
MAALAEAMKAGIWFDRSKVEDAEYKYQEYLVRGSVKVVTKPKKAAGQSSGGVSQKIAEARQKIQDTLKDTSSASSSNDVEELKKQVKELNGKINAMTKNFQSLESRLSALEGGAKSTTANPATPKTPTQNGAADSEESSDEDLFGSSDEDDGEAERIRQERLDAYKAKKSKKPTTIAKSNIILDVKPWSDETDMAELEKCVRSVQTDGLLWGASKLVKIAYGVRKLQITCVVEDDKVGTDFLEEEITAFDEYIQSVDIAAFNKI